MIFLEHLNTRGAIICNMIHDWKRSAHFESVLFSIYDTAPRVFFEKYGERFKSEKSPGRWLVIGNWHRRHLCGRIFKRLMLRSQKCGFHVFFVDFKRWTQFIFHSLFWIIWLIETLKWSKPCFLSQTIPHFNLLIFF